MKKIVLIILASLSLFGVDKAEFPNNNMNVIITGVFLDNSSDETNEKYQKFGNTLIKTINSINKNKDDLTANIKQIHFKLKNSTELSIFQVAQEYQFDKTKLINALTVNLKPNTLKIGIKFIPDDTNLRLDVYRIYNESIDTLPLVEYLSFKFPKNSNYSDVIKYIILSDFQDFETTKREIVSPTIIANNEKYKLNFYSNNTKMQKYFSQNVKKRNIDLLNKLNITDIKRESTWFGDDAKVSLNDAQKYCALYNMKIPDLSLVNSLNSDSFSEGGVYQLDNKALKIYTPNKMDTDTFFCAGTNVKQIDTYNIDKTKLDEDDWPKIFSKKEVDLTTIKYETK